MPKEEKTSLAQIHFRSKPLSKKLRVLTIRLGGIPISRGHNAKTILVIPELLYYQETSVEYIRNRSACSWKQIGLHLLAGREIRFGT